MKNILIVILTVIIVLLLGDRVFENYGSSGSNFSNETQNTTFSGMKIRLAKQYGMQYAAVYVAEHLNLIEKYLPGIEVEWNSFGGGAAITEALIGGHLDVGFMGIPPALVAIDKGASIKIALGVSVPPNDLMARESIKSIKEIKPTDKIAVPGIGSIQHILLSIGAKKYLGDARALDNNMITMSNPDAFSSLVGGKEIVGHFTVMPYLEKEKQQGFHKILSGSEAFGDASIVCVTSEKLHNNPQIYAGLVAALSEAVYLVSQRNEEVIKIISDVEKISQEEVIKYLEWPGTNYTTNVYGLMGLAKYMYEAGYIENEPKLNDYVWDNVMAMAGKRAGEKSAIEAIIGE